MREGRRFKSHKPKHNHSYFRVSSASRKEHKTAFDRIADALDHSSNCNGKRIFCDMYVGNLEFSADNKDLSEAISVLCSPGRLHIEKASVPPGKGRNRGYGFITLSWPKDAPIDPADIYTTTSGVIKVHSRPIYLCAIEKASSDRSESEHETSTASQDASDCSESDQDTSTASKDASDNPESEHDTSYDSSYSELSYRQLQNRLQRFR